MKQMYTDKWSDYEFCFEDGRFFLFVVKVLPKNKTFWFLRFLVINYNSYLEQYKSFKKSYHRASYLK